MNYQYSIKMDHYWKSEWSQVPGFIIKFHFNIESDWFQIYIYFQCMVECEIQSLKFICMRKFRNNTIQEQSVDVSYCQSIRKPLVEPITRLCSSSKECIVQIDLESTDNDKDNEFSPGMLALIIVLSLIMIVTFAAVTIRIYFPHFVHLCLKQLHFQ